LENSKNKPKLNFTQKGRNYKKEVLGPFEREKLKRFNKKGRIINLEMKG